jgi:hypothetical protein
MNPDYYPSVSIVAGPLTLARDPIGTLGHMLKMHGGATYITITPDVARQWIQVLEKVAANAPKTPESRGFLVE